MAVLREWRGRGVGSAVMARLLQLAREARHEVVRLHAQTHALGFYEKHGFVAEGEEFMEAGIPHFLMSASSETSGLETRDSGLGTGLERRTVAVSLGVKLQS